jgi:hypothetical protein
MSDICLHFDARARQEVEDLKSYYDSPNTASLIRLGFSLLRTVKDIQQSDGQLIAKKDNMQTIIKVS